jgi:DNA replicative helicase MCM subunit Mcm2 (Cdc46/Mcm family)
MMRSQELEDCCIKNGYCCVDEFDVDGDNDRTEMLGRCEAVTCAP